MITRTKQYIQNEFFTSFLDTLSQKHPLYLLSNKIDWSVFEQAFEPLFCNNNGRPIKPIRRMCGLLILKHLRNLSDESVVEQWSENSYYQYFCGETNFVASFPCNASELVHFRKRIGETGIELILKESIKVNDTDTDTDNKTDKESEVSFIDSTVQEKNITYPTDAKLHKKIIKKCQSIAKEESIKVRQTYNRTLKQLYLDQRFRGNPKNTKKVRKADNKIKTIAGRLVRELERHLGSESKYQPKLIIFNQILSQTKTSKNKIYSIHEPDVRCISKGKEHKKYEFGNKVSIIRRASGVIIGALSFRNEYDGHTIEESLKQAKRLTGKTISTLAGDRGYRGKKKVGDTQIVIPSAGKASATRYSRNKDRELFRKRAGIEPTIGHLKSDYRLGRNFYKGVVGDAINVMLAAAAYNFKRAMRVLLCLYFWLKKILTKWFIYQDFIFKLGF